MTDLADAPATGRAHVADLADNFTALVRTFNRARARWLAAAAHDVEWSSHVLLRSLQVEGPMRAGALADCVHSDPSTVSRQVAALVKDGLVERQSDPADGRASLLVITPKAVAVLADHDEIRNSYFGSMVADWDVADVEQFAHLLKRFTDAYSSANAEWIYDKLARSAAAEQTDAQASPASTTGSTD